MGNGLRIPDASSTGLARIWPIGHKNGSVHIHTHDDSAYMLSCEYLPLYNIELHIATSIPDLPF